MAIADRAAGALRHRWPYLLAVLALAVLSWQPAQMTDGWMYAATGRWIVDHHAVPWTDPFTWTFQGDPWQSNGWLWAVLAYISTNALGAVGMAALKPLFTVAICLSIRWAARRLGASSLAADLGSLVGTLLMLVWIAERPQLVSFVALALVLGMTGEALAGGALRWRWVVALGLVVVVWSNFHSGSLGALPMVGALAAGRVVMEQPWRHGRLFRRLADLVLVMVVATLATLITPYGLSMWTYTRDIRQYSQASVSEWFHPWAIQNSFGPISLVAMAVVVVVALLWGVLRRLDLTFALAMALLLSLDAIRNVAFFTITAAIVLAVIAPPAWVRRLERRGDLARVGAVGLLVVALALGGPRVLATGDPDTDVPVGPVAALPSGCRLANDVRIGNWVMWSRPDIPVSVDGRNDVYRDRFFSLIWFKQEPDPLATLAELDRLGVDCAVSRTDVPIVKVLEDAGWTEVGADPSTVALVRPGRP